MKIYEKHFIQFELEKKETLNLITCWQIEISVGVSALESGVVPKNRTIFIGLQSLNQSVNAKDALFASNEVFPQPPLKYRNHIDKLTITILN